MQMYAGKTRAAFAILKGEPVPNDPVHGMPYPWNPTTHELIYPPIPLYEKHNRALVVPKRQAINFKSQILNFKF